MKLYVFTIEAVYETPALCFERRRSAVCGRDEEDALATAAHDIRRIQRTGYTLQSLAVIERQEVSPYVRDLPRTTPWAVVG